MTPRIENLKEKKLVGKRIQMNLINDRTGELWQSFMPRRNEVKNRLASDFYSMQIYDELFKFEAFSPNTFFTKWAAVEVSDFKVIPDEMETFLLPGGLYAVFVHKGSPSGFPKTFQFIFGTWFPNSAFEVDNRPHFELLSKNYRPDDPNAEEEIWIPIKELT
jgi:AraC family transcriptional regulator